MCSTTYLPFGQRQQSTQVSLRGVRKIENDLYCIEALFSPMGSMPLIPLQVVRGNLYWGLQFFTLLTCLFQAWNIFQIRISVTLGIPGRQWNSQWQPWRCPGFIEILRYIGQKNQAYVCGRYHLWISIWWYLGSSGIWHWHIGTLTIPTEVGGTMPIYGCRSGLSSFPGWPLISQPSVDAATVRYYSASHPAAGEHDNDPWPAKTAPKNACRNTDGLQRQVSQVLFLRCCGAGLATN